VQLDFVAQICVAIYSYILSYGSWFCVASCLQLLVLYGFFPNSSWFYMASRSVQLDFLAQIYVATYILSYSSWFCVASFLQLLVLYGFVSHSSWFYMASRSVQKDFVAQIYVASYILSYNSWFCVAPSLQLVLYGFFPRAPGFIRLLVLCSWIL